MRTKGFFRCAIIAIALMGTLSVWAHDGEHTYVNGVCSIEGCEDPYEAPAQDAEGYFLVANAGNVEWISDYVQNVSNTPNVKMTADIDFTGVNHTMIGRNDARKFNGTWDGQGHRIKNLVLNYGSADTPTAIGFFAWVRGGSTIKNLIMDQSCYFEGKVRVAAFVGVTQVVSGGPVRIENCINEAKVQGHTGATGGFIGCRNPNNQDTPQNIISGCVNLGDILCDANEAGAFVGWANSASEKHIVENSFNMGNVSVDGNGRGFIRGDNLQITNSYDFGANAAKNSQKASHEWTTADPIESGELAFFINETAGKTVFYQTIGTDAYPVPFSDGHEQVYAHGNYRCDGELLPGTVYDNTPGEGAVIPPHNYSANGLCQNDGCTKPFQAPEVDAEGWTLLANAGNVESFSETIAGGSGSIVAKAKLTADIDFEGIENLHSPIGPSTGCKFKGEFDGQGHHIKNMIINQPTKEAQGFFGWLQGNSNTYIHDLIIDSSCSVTAANKAGALAGASQNYNEAATIRIENIVTSANVTVSGQDAAAIVGGESGNKANFLVRNVINRGDITSTNEYPYAGALFCYQERGTVENFVNLGTITGHLGGNIGRFNGGTMTNVVDLSELTEDKTQGVVEGLTKNDVSSGVLAYWLNTNDTQEEDAFTQTIGTDDYPMPFATSLKVYGGKWDGLNTVAYNNEDGVVTAGRLIISDAAEAFAVPEGATSVIARKVMYERSNVAGFNTVCLPFALTSGLAGAALYKVSSVESDYIVLEAATEAAAGEPVLVQFPTDYEDSWYVERGKTDIVAAPVGTGVLKGAFAAATIGEGKYKLNATGTAFGRTTAAATIKAFRAYVEAESSAAELKIWNDETGIGNVERAALDIQNAYTLSGQRVNTLQKGVNIVRMANGETKKIVVK